MASSAAEAAPLLPPTPPAGAPSVSVQPLPTESRRDEVMKGASDWAALDAVVREARAKAICAALAGAAGAASEETLVACALFSMRAMGDFSDDGPKYAAMGAARMLEMSKGGTPEGLLEAFKPMYASGDQRGCAALVGYEMALGLDGSGQASATPPGGDSSGSAGVEGGDGSLPDEDSAVPLAEAAAAEEMAAMPKSMAELEEFHGRVFDRMDTNGDGFIAISESWLYLHRVLRTMDPKIKTDYPMLFQGGGSGLLGQLMELNERGLDKAVPKEERVWPAPLAQIAETCEEWDGEQYPEKHVNRAQYIAVQTAEIRSKMENRGQNYFEQMAKAPEDVQKTLLKAYNICLSGEPVRFSHPRGWWKEVLKEHLSWGFHAADADNTGKVTNKQFADWAEAAGAEKGVDGRSMEMVRLPSSPAQPDGAHKLADVLKAVDETRRNHAPPMLFMDVWCKLRGKPTFEDEAGAQFGKLFDAMDTDSDGKVSMADIETFVAKACAHAKTRYDEGGTDTLSDMLRWRRDDNVRVKLQNGEGVEKAEYVAAVTKNISRDVDCACPKFNSHTSVRDYELCQHLGVPWTK